MRISKADFVNPILERATLYLQEHAENFERPETKAKSRIFCQKGWDNHVNAD